MPDFEHNLEFLKPRTLTSAKRNSLWVHIGLKLAPQHHATGMIHALSKRVIALITATALVLGGGAAVAFAANDARPGDTLFPVDQAVENIMLTFTFGGVKEKLEMAISKERFGEVMALLSEEDANASVSGSGAIAMTTAKPAAKTAAPMAMTTFSATAAEDTAPATPPAPDQVIKSDSRVNKALAVALDRIETSKATIEKLGDQQNIDALNDMLAQLDAIASSHGYVITTVDAKAKTDGQKLNLAFNAKNNDSGSSVALKLTARSSSTLATTTDNWDRNDSKDHGKDDDHRDTNNGSSNGNKYGWNNFFGFFGHKDNPYDNNRGNNDHDNRGDQNNGHNEKVTVCHSGHTVTVLHDAIQGYIKQGDTYGPCTSTATSTPDTTAPTFTSTTVATGQTTANITWNTNEKTTGTLIYSTSTSATSGDAKTVFANTLASTHTANISGLTQNTEYRYIIVAKDLAGNTSTSTEKVFSTKTENDTVAPTLSAITATPTLTGAIITWNTNESANGKVFYGTSTKDMLATHSGMSTGHSVTLSDLATSTTYTYVVVSQDLAGNTSTSTDRTFITLTPEDNTPPVISGVTTTGITSIFANVIWETNEPAKSTVRYGTVTPLDLTASTTQSVLASTLVSSHLVPLTGLTASTTYYYVVSSEDSHGNVATGTEHSFTTE
jgi:hypothetical protein